VIVGVLPSYHHLKKAIFQLNQEASFKEAFALQHVITKVSAKNFYLNKHRNVNQFLLENCLKGICDCIVFERGFFPQDEVAHIRRVLSEVNSEANVLTVKGKSMAWPELSRILTRKHDKFTLLYGKHFYGFEKEGRSAFYSEK
jgi:G3E family GTPase